ncbi:MAG: MiaB/RimO family radical SAM methylthiotransferase [Coriobacteriales bacterium]|jgi:threonylcarbamoyladenosine tRNA methylthiotransferase MtaB|nr:MiaB/RimO family radical SAM methylthiotransferase [Coriobacteriales bacterium]
MNLSEPEQIAGFALFKLGCKVNQADGDYLANSLLDMGAQLVEASQAELIIVTTCTVTGEADSKARKTVRRLLAKNPRAWLLACGCAVAINKESYSSLGERVVVQADLASALREACRLLGLAGRVEDRAASTQRPLGYCGQSGTEGLSGTSEQSGPHKQTNSSIQFDSNIQTYSTQRPANRQRQYLKIQDGCDSACSYCIVHVARGPAVSLSLSELVANARQAEAKGLRELVLTGVNLGSYQDQTEGLCDLLQALLNNTSNCRYRLSSLEPLHLSERLIDLIASSEHRICAHLHLPLQSASDEVLSRMNRPYTSSEYSERVALARDRLPHLALSTDVIVGFPGETDSDFRATLDFCRRMAFMRLHVFCYSRRPGTPAAAFAGQVSAEVKAERSLELRQLAEQLTQADLQKRLGQRELVLIERPGLGRAESYHQVRLDAALPVGDLVELCFSGIREQMLE